VGWGGRLVEKAGPEHVFDVHDIKREKGFFPYAFYPPTVERRYWYDTFSILLACPKDPCEHWKAPLDEKSLFYPFFQNSSKQSLFYSGNNRREK
jgi:hypothetical protein